jgi:uncharacterized low-complexity protein
MYSKLLAAIVASALSLSAFAAVETDTKDEKDKVERAILVADNHGDHDHGDAKEGEAKAEEEKPAEEPKKIEYEDPTKYYPKK